MVVPGPMSLPTSFVPDAREAKKRADSATALGVAYVLSAMVLHPRTPAGHKTVIRGARSDRRRGRRREISDRRRVPPDRRTKPVAARRSPGRKDRADRRPPRLR